MRGRTFDSSGYPQKDRSYNSRKGTIEHIRRANMLKTLCVCLWRVVYLMRPTDLWGCWFCAPQIKYPLFGGLFGQTRLFMVNTTSFGFLVRD